MGLDALDTTDLQEGVLQILRSWLPHAWIELDEATDFELRSFDDWLGDRGGPGNDPKMGGALGGPGIPMGEFPWGIPGGSPGGTLGGPWGVP